MTKRPTGTYITTAAGGENVNAFVPNALPPALNEQDLAKLAEPLQRAEAAVDRLRLASEMLPSLDWVVYAFVRKEALLSSEIEGIQATLVDVLSFEHTKQVGSSSIADLGEVANYVSAMNYALGELHSKSGLPLSTRLLNECHRRLMQGSGSANKRPGEIRRSQNWIGGTRPGNAVFVPPPPDTVTGLLGDLERYIHSDDDLPPLLRIAAAHVQFEAIHPYLDGNGRVGRMLIAMLLEHWRQLSSPLLYMSVHFLERQRDYYHYLESVRTNGDWVSWFNYFLEGIAVVATDATDRARQLHRLVDEDRQKLLSTNKVTVSAIQLFEKLPGHPVISMPLVTRLLHTSKPTATKAIETMKQAEILFEVGRKKRDRLYSYKKYVKALR